MPRVDKLLMNIQKAEESIATPEAITDSLTKVASITAKGLHIKYIPKHLKVILI